MDILKVLRNKKIISQRDIENFKHYIHKKYGTLEEERKEVILKNSISFVVQRDLSKLEISNYDSIIHHFVEEILFNKKLFNKKKDLFADEVFQTLISNQDPSEDFLISLTKWVNQYMDKPLHHKVLKEHCVKKQEFNGNKPRFKQINWLLGWLIILILALPFISYTAITTTPINPVIPIITSIHMREHRSISYSTATSSVFSV